MLLAEKYRPRKIADFLGLEKPKRMLPAFVANPQPSVWLFIGPPGVGKSSMARALADELPGGGYLILRHATRCNVEDVRELRIAAIETDVVQFSIKPGSWRVYLVDEVDEVPYQAQLAFLPILDPEKLRSKIIFIFTCNSTEKLHSGLMDRCAKLDFSVHGAAEDIADRLEEIWNQEADNAEPRPDFLQLVRRAHNSVRDALIALEQEFLLRPKPAGKPTGKPLEN